MISECKILNFDIMGGNEGSLVALQQNINIPFDIKRVYYIFGTKSEAVRGRHAHSDLEQVLICISGSCTLLLDNGSQREKLRLDNPGVGIYLGKNIWREMSDFTPDCVLLVLASDFYKPDEYIRSYEEFLKCVK